MRSLIVLSLLMFSLAAEAQQKPLRPPAATSEEQRYHGVDFAGWPVVQALGSSTEAIRHAGTGEPICVEWEAIIATRADAVTCWCWAQKINGVVIAAPTADGGCVITDDRGRDGYGRCWTTAAAETKWKSPDFALVRSAPTAADGLCSVATSTTTGFGRASRHPCQADSDCTTSIGSGTCDSLSSYTSASATSLRYSTSCGFLLARSAAATTAYVEGGR